MKKIQIVHGKKRSEKFLGTNFFFFNRYLPLKIYFFSHKQKENSLRDLHPGNAEQLKSHALGYIGLSLELAASSVPHFACESGHDDVLKLSFV